MTRAGMSIAPQIEPGWEPARVAPRPVEAAVDAREGQDPAEDRILVVGEESRARRVRASLEAQQATVAGVVTAVSVGEAARWVREQHFEVVVLVAPIRGATIEHALSMLRVHQSSDAPTQRVVLVPEGFPEVRARDLYARGAGGVFAWPGDLNVLASLIGSCERAETAPETDPLERAVRERLRLRMRRVSSGVEVDADRARGVARLSGRVSSLWAKRALKRRARESPGVEEVEASALEVDESERSDAAIGRDIRALLDGTATIDATTLGVSVHDGSVVLLGAVLDHERDHVIELISMVSGVRSVSDRSLSSLTDKRRAGVIADRLQLELQRTGAGGGLRVAVVGTMAVLRGVGSPREIRTARRRLRRWIRGSNVLRKVVERAGARLQRA